ncbi:hypothetical protein BD779DRAFT_1473619 [Infundibulicybe gibba]|nr:hypothetical protein BD779DRAFT_1473619 [Infundibulicybe gibba]
MSDATTARNRLMQCATYLANPLFNSLVEWRVGKKESFAVEKLLEDKKTGDGKVLPAGSPNDEDALIILVGVVSDDRYALGPCGSYNPTYGIEEAKYQLSLDRPTDQVLGADYDIGVKALRRLQDNIATGEDSRFLILENNGAVSVRLTRKVLEKRVKVLAGGMTDDKKEKMLNFPGTVKFREEIRSFTDTHEVSPVIVWENDTTEIDDELQVAQKVEGALVEAYFRVRHMLFDKKGQPPYNTFTGILEQLVILKPREAPNPSPSFRGVKRTSPYRPKPMVVKEGPNQSIAGDGKEATVPGEGEGSGRGKRRRT